MLIALLVVLGIDLIVIVGLAAIVVARRRWLKRQPGEFAGAIRVTGGGDVPGLGSKWRHGSGRWVRDVLVWHHGAFMFRTELVPVDQCTGERRADAGELKHLGDAPVVVQLACASANIEVAARADHRVHAMGPDNLRADGSREPAAGIIPSASAHPEPTS